MTSSSIICSNPQSTSNLSWKHPVTSFPIHITLSIFHESILYHLFQSTYHLKLSLDMILYHLF
jgi:hypothetical protein